MILLDANILLYAYDVRAEHHGKVRGYLEALLSGKETIGLPWITVWAFIRISTNPRLWEQPLSAPEALAVIAEVRQCPLVMTVNPGRRHEELLAEQMAKGQVRGAATTDAVLAALAIENGAVFASTDAGFGRFAALRWTNPLQAKI